MDVFIEDEVNKIHAQTTFSDFETQVMGDVIKWSVDSGVVIDDLPTAFDQFWDQHLN